MSAFHASLQAAYAGRMIELDNLPALVRELAQTRPEPADRLARAYAELLRYDFDERLGRLQRLQRERELLRKAERQHEEGRIDLFRFQGRDYDSAEARRLLERTDRKLDEEERWWADFDRRVFVVHYGMACNLGDEAAHKLRSHYGFHLAMQNVVKETSRRLRRLARIEDFMDDSDAPLEQADFQQVRTELIEAQNAFEKSLAALCRLTAPALDCLPAGEMVGNLLRTSPPVSRLRPAMQSVSGKWIGKFARQLEEVRDNAEPIVAESLAALLEKLELTAQQWQRQTAGLPEVEEAEELSDLDAAEEGLQPVGGEKEYELSEEDVLTAAEEIQKPDLELDEEPDEEEFQLSEHDVLAEPGEAGGHVEVENLDDDDHTNRPRHWNV